MEYTCPKCLNHIEANKFFLSDEKWAQCPMCEETSLMIGIQRYVPPAKEGTVDITPEGYSTLAKAVKLTQAHERYNALVGKSHNFLCMFLEDDFSKAELHKHLNQCREAHDELISAVCGR